MSADDWDDDPKDDGMPTVDLQGPGSVGPLTCQFCKRNYYILTAELAVAHDQPYCAEFQALDMLDFLQTNREIRQERTPRA